MQRVAHRALAGVAVRARAVAVAGGLALVVAVDVAAAEHALLPCAGPVEPHQHPAGAAGVARADGSGYAIGQRGRGVPVGAGGQHPVGGRGQHGVQGAEGGQRAAVAVGAGGRVAHHVAQAHEPRERGIQARFCRRGNGRKQRLHFLADVEFRRGRYRVGRAALGAGGRPGAGRRGGRFQEQVHQGGLAADGGGPQAHRNGQVGGHQAGGLAIDGHEHARAVVAGRVGVVVEGRGQRTAGYVGGGHHDRPRAGGGRGCAVAQRHGIGTGGKARHGGQAIGAGRGRHSADLDRIGSHAAAALHFDAARRGRGDGREARSAHQGQGGAVAGRCARLAGERGERGRGLGVEAEQGRAFAIGGQQRVGGKAVTGRAAGKAIGRVNRLDKVAQRAIRVLVVHGRRAVAGGTRPLPDLR